MPLFIYLLSSDGRLHAYAGIPPDEARISRPTILLCEQLIGRKEPVELPPANLQGT